MSSISRKAAAPRHATASLTSSNSTRGHYLLAASVSATLVAVVGVTLPDARHQLATVQPFLPAFATFALLADVLTAFLLFGQFFGTRAPAIGILAATYLYSSLIIIPHILTFSGVFSPTGLLNAQPQTATWLWVFWHGGFPVGIICYVLADWRFGQIKLSPRHALYFLAFFLVFIPLVVAMLAYVAIDWVQFLPTLIKKGNFTLLITSGVGPVIWCLNALACISVLLRLRGRTIMQLWLTVAALASWFDVTLTLFAGSRFSAGWYVARLNSLLAAAIVLCALLFEINRLYRRLARQNTVLEEQNDAIQAATQQKSIFLANMSHELRTPLNAILGFTELLYDEKVGPVAPDQREFLGDVHSSAKHLLELINDVLDLSKVEAGKMEFTPATVDLHTLVQGVQDTLHPLIVTKKLVFAVVIDPDIKLVTLDAAKLKQVLFNYLSNAIKFTREHGQVTLHITADNGTLVRFAVEDSGIGISPADLKKLFAEFQQADSGAAGHQQGTGLGLALTKKIIEAQGGAVGVISTPGQGSTFWATLPCREASTAAMAVAA